jgi:hypothetical protein
VRPDLESVKQALLDAGVEIYKTEDAEIAVAERVRLHIMDSGVRVRVSDRATVLFTARSQQSDFPEESADILLERVRGSVGSQAGTRGYREADAATIEVKDPVDENRVLDVWHEVTYEKPTEDLQAVVDEVRWALEVDKYVAR